MTNVDEKIFGNFTKDYGKHCRFIRLAIDRFRQDCKRDDIYFDVKAAQRVFDFIGFFRHHKGEFKDKKFDLLDWQKFALGNIFGWKWKATGLRKYGTAYIEIPRKNGKTTLASAVANYMLMADGEAGAEVYCVATKEDQAKIAWNDCKIFLEGQQTFNKSCRKLVKSIHYDRQHAVLKPLGSDSKTLDGLNPSCAIFDELHAWERRDLWDVIEDGLGARKQPLIFAITTAGYNQQGICFEQRTNAINILNGVSSDDDIFALIFTLDDDDDYQDERNWYKANPSLGYAKNIEIMRKLFVKCKNTPEKLNAFLNKQLNIWTTASAAWKNLDDWKSLEKKIDDAQLKGKYCFGGLDLSRKQDLTAFVLYFPPQVGLERGYVKPYFIIPSENFREKELLDRVPYSAWQDAGWVKLTNAKTVSDEFVFDQIKDALDSYDVRNVAFDRWGSKDITKLFDARGVKIVDFGQGYKDMSPAIKRFEELIDSRKIWQDGNPCLAWNISNCVITQDSAENVKFDKEKARQRIDGAVATAMAIGASMREPHNQTPNWILAELNK